MQGKSRCHVQISFACMYIICHVNAHVNTFTYIYMITCILLSFSPSLCLLFTVFLFHVILFTHPVPNAKMTRLVRFPS